MGDPRSGTCSHGMAPTTCLICQTLTPTPSRRGRIRPVEGGAPAPRRSPVLGSALVVMAVAGLLALLLVSWFAALAWALFRLLELVAVAAVAGWIGWRLGVRHGRRHPR